MREPAVTPRSKHCACNPATAGIITHLPGISKPDIDNRPGDATGPPSRRSKNRQRVALFFQRAAGDADAIHRFQAAPDFFAGQAVG